MKATDQQVIDAWSQTRSYAAAGRILGIDRTNVKTRILYMRDKGVALPEPLGVGKYIRKKSGHDRSTTTN